MEGRQIFREMRCHERVPDFFTPSPQIKKIDKHIPHNDGPLIVIQVSYFQVVRTSSWTET